MKLQLPIPPSVNHIFRATRRGTVYRSKKYVDWHHAAELMAHATKKGKVPPPPFNIIMNILGGSGWRKDRDLDNCWKPVLDLLQHLHIIPEDNCQTITSLTVTYQKGCGGPAECHVHIKGI
ncbi:MAG: RusA family crossover junction endodeoxyribonuclease [Rhodobacteraceae bacterium]|nr:RusA family crossover junction endodeoxyribonuclease [Paracoccaceae bacterium]